MNPSGPRLGLRIALAAACIFAAPLAASAQEELPEYFKIGPQGDLTCVGALEDACAYYDEIPVPGKTLFLVQGSYSVKSHPAQLRQIGPHILNYYFALLCEREGDTLKPVFNFLEGRERASDIHLHDLDADGVPEVIVVGAFDSRGSYASVYRVESGRQVQIFTRRANTPNIDFEVDHGAAVITLEQRNPKTHGDLVREVFVWNGKEFALQS